MGGIALQSVGEVPLSGRSRRVVRAGPGANPASGGQDRSALDAALRITRVADCALRLLAQVPLTCRVAVAGPVTKTASGGRDRSAMDAALRVGRVADCTLCFVA